MSRASLAQTTVPLPAGRRRFRASRHVTASALAQSSSIDVDGSGTLLLYPRIDSNPETSTCDEVKLFKILCEGAKSIGPEVCVGPTENPWVST